MADSKLNIIIDVINKSGSKLSGLKGEIQSLEKPLQQLAVASSAVFVGLSAGILKSVKEASDLTESINAVNVVFGEGAKNILDFGKNSAKAVGLSTSQFNQMATVTGALLKDTGRPLEEVADLTNELAVRASDMASVFNTDVTDAMSAINQALRGETEAIRRYAGDVTDATLQQYLNAQGINKTTTELTEQEKRLYRVALILQQTSTYAGDFANTSDSLANSQRILKAEMTNLAVVIGQEFEPILKDLMNTISPMVSAVAEWVKAHPELTKNILLLTVAISGMIAVVTALSLAMIAISPVALGVGAVIVGLVSSIYMINEAIKILQNDWDLVWSGLLITASSVANAVIGVFENMVNYVVDAINGVITSINEMIQKMRDVPMIGKAFKGIKDISLVDRVELGRIDQNALVSPSRVSGGTNLTITGNTFMSDEESAEKIGNMLMSKLRLNTSY
jgi:hypothetical protein